MTRVDTRPIVPCIIRTVVRLLDLLRDVPRHPRAGGSRRRGARRGPRFAARAARASCSWSSPGERHDARAYVPQALERALSAWWPMRRWSCRDRALLVVPPPDRALADLAAALRATLAAPQAGRRDRHGRQDLDDAPAGIYPRPGRASGPLADHRRPQDRRPPGRTPWITPPRGGPGPGGVGRDGCDGVQTAILEVSSHALALDRSGAANSTSPSSPPLSPEHLNFHGTMEKYARAKSRLFEMLGEPSETKAGPRLGVVNADDPASAVMRERCPTAVLTYGIEQPTCWHETCIWACAARRSGWSRRAGRRR